MATMDAQSIFDNFHTHAKGTQGLMAVAQTAQQLAAKYQDRALTTQQMIDTIHSGWKGAAAEAASQGLAPLAENALNNHQQLGTGQDIVSRQVAAAGGQNPQTVLEQIAHRQAVQQSNVDVYNRYVGASQYNTTNVPTLNTIDTPDAPNCMLPCATPTADADAASRSSFRTTASVAWSWCSMPVTSRLPQPPKYCYATGCGTHIRGS